MSRSLRPDDPEKFKRLVQEQLELQYPKQKENEFQKAYRQAQPKSPGEELFFAQWKAYADLPMPEREVELVAGRDWRCDFVWKEKMLVVEIEGGVFTGGRHVRGKGFTQDVRKYRELEKRGYRVLRFTTEMVEKWEAFNETVRIFQSLP